MSLKTPRTFQRNNKNDNLGLTYRRAIGNKADGNIHPRTIWWTIKNKYSNTSKHHILLPRITMICPSNYKLKNVIFTRTIVKTKEKKLSQTNSPKPVLPKTRRYFWVRYFSSKPHKSSSVVGLNHWAVALTMCRGIEPEMSVAVGQVPWPLVGQLPSQGFPFLRQTLLSKSYTNVIDERRI